MIVKFFLKNDKYFSFILAIFLVVLLTSSVRSWLRIHTTLIGYELGESKLLEESLLEKRSVLQMDLAKITTKDHLLILSKRN